MSHPRHRIIVAGLMGYSPLGGMAWHYLQYVIGLARLGHHVYYHEDTWSWPYHPPSKTYVADADYSAKFIGEAFGRYAPQLSGRWHYRHLNETSFGMSHASFTEVTRTADMFVNVSGACRLPQELSPHCIKVFLDTDPGYNQIVLSEKPEWSENVDRWCASVKAHDRHFTLAENINAPDCLVPRMDFAWQTTRVPVVLDLWDWVAHRPSSDKAPWTTVMTWNAFKGKLTYGSVEYQSKGTEFERMIDLPRRTNVALQVALGSDTAKERLLAQHWQVVDGSNVTRTPERYQEFIAGSRAEVSPAKHVYVAMRTGWFSCRSSCYLASARPVVVQNTCFSPELPLGVGILPFTTTEEAADAIGAIERDYERHSRAARAIAEEHFDSDKVLRRLVDEAMSGPG